MCENGAQDPDVQETPRTQQTIRAAGPWGSIIVSWAVGIDYYQLGRGDRLLPELMSSQCLVSEVLGKGGFSFFLLQNIV